MSKPIIDSINEQLNEEKWTRAALNNYTINHFQELDAILDKVFEEKQDDDVEALCEEHLQHTKNSIISLYISGIIHLSRQSIDDSRLLTLIGIFVENHRWKIVQYLCERILDFSENKHALRHLADALVSSGEEDSVFPVWERLIRVDYDEADIVRRLAEHAEEQKDLESATDFYKKALHRYINKKMFNQVIEIWKKLVDLVPDEVDFFYHAEVKASKLLNPERAVQLLELLYPSFVKAEKWDTAIEILKRILVYDSKNAWARKEITDCYQAKYKNHSQLAEYIKLSNISQSWRDVHEAIQDFEKHISFDAGNFVFHRNWGVGRIKEIRNDQITINFVQKPGHKMTLKMAVNSLTILGKDHIWVYRITKSKEALNAKVKKDIVWALKTLIRSFDNAADMKKIKAELVPHILSPNEWSTWSTKARAELKINEMFGNLPENPDVYVVRDQPINFVEKTFNRFKAEKDFHNRMKIMQEFLGHLEIKNDSDAVETDLFREMFDYFVSYVRNISNVNEQTISSYLLVKRLSASFNFLNPGTTATFKELFATVANPEEVFPNIENPEIRKDFLVQVKKQIKEWPQVYVSLIPHYLQKEPVAELVKAGHEKEVANSFMQIFQTYKDHRESFVWFVRNFHNEDWFKALSISQEKLLIALLNLQDLTARDIDNRRDVLQNRKINRQLELFLFKEETISEYIKTSDAESISRIFSLIEDVKDLDPKIVQGIRVQITRRFPDLKFYGAETAPTSVSRGGFFTLAKSFEERQRGLMNLLDVEVPKNSKEIATARDYGDLKENAEYKAAKERQEILNNTAARWKEDLERAQIVPEDEIDTTRAGFGTKVTLYNNITKKEEAFTIMGPWESNPEKQILSHLSPFAGELLNAQVGDKLEFTINERAYDYVVKKIELADLAAIEPLPVTV